MTEPNQTPNHYELLGVDRTADAATISKAWRRRTRRTGPGSPEFARLNEAAETLLNPDKRADYDATIPAPVVAEKWAEPDPGVAVGTEQSPASTTAPAGGRRPRRFGLAVAVVAVLTALAVVAVVLAVIYHGKKEDDASVTAAREEASAAARTAVGVVLGYSWQTMDADLKNDLGYLTPDYAKTFTENFNLLTASKDGAASAVAQTKTIVTAAVTGTAVMDATAKRVNVLVFADQTVVHKAGSKQQECPCVLHDRVKVSMLEHDGKWLIDDLQTS